MKWCGLTGGIWGLLNISILCHVLITITIKYAHTNMLDLFVWCKESLATVCPDEPSRNPPPSTRHVLMPLKQCANQDEVLQQWSTHSTHICTDQGGKTIRNQTTGFIHYLTLTKTYILRIQISKYYRYLMDMHYKDIPAK